LVANCSNTTSLFISGQLAAASVDWSRSSPAKKTPDAAAMAEIASISKVRCASISLCNLYSFNQKSSLTPARTVPVHLLFCRCVECSLDFLRRVLALFTAYSLLYLTNAALTTDK